MKSKAVKDPMCKQPAFKRKEEAPNWVIESLIKLSEHAGSKGLCFFQAKLIEATETLLEELSGWIEESSALQLEAYVASNVVPLPRSCGNPPISNGVRR